MIGRKPSHRETAEFCRMLASSVERGVPLDRAMEIIAAQAWSRRLKKALGQVRGAVQDGASLPDALGRSPAIFPSEFGSYIGAGHRGGRLAEVLRHLETYSSLRVRLSRSAWRILVYALSPILAIVGLLIVIGPFYDNYLIETLVGFGRTTPARVVPGTTLGSAWGLVAAILLLVLGLPAMYFFRGAISRSRIGYYLPAWGRIQRSRDLGLLCSVLGLSLEARRPLPESLVAAATVVPNRYARKMIRRAMARVEEGEDLSSAFFYDRHIPRTLSWAISVGEARGDVPQVFRLFADLHRANLERSFEILTLVLGPTAVLLVGCLVGYLAIGFFGYWGVTFRLIVGF